MSLSVIGWDIGGAHLKAALLDGAGQSLHVVQVPCPLWQGIAKLDQAFVEVMKQLPSAVYRHAVTMTGELVDGFDSRQQGVAAIIASVLRQFPNGDCWIYAGSAGFLAPDDVGEPQVMQIASANWWASASLAASFESDALFVDTGSTTTDILLIEANQLRNLGYTDYERLISSELVYTGVVRSAVMAVAQTALFNGHEMGLMTEHFATMADVYRVTGDLDEAHDQYATADGAEKSPIASARRLSRMTGYEFDVREWGLWLAFAQHLKARQKALIGAACLEHRARSLHPDAQIMIGAGVGRFLIRELAEDWGMPYRDYRDYFSAPGFEAVVDAADCAPAVAVAYLAQRMP
jgi:(4-(4-[2-(gamma-L-glutamylamino)ethyl]phenoxymethyl)furan-2-yl)methanamine synthase